MESRSGSPSEIWRQADRLVEWAKARGLVLPNNYTSSLEKFEQTSTEHEVFLRPSDHRVVKCTYPGAFGKIKDNLDGKPRNATPLDYLRRLELMKEVFGYDSIIEGISFGTPRSGNKRQKLPFLIISQRFIESDNEKFSNPSEQDISEFLMSLGFMPVKDSVYQWYRNHDKIVVCDAKPANFIKSPEGVIPIDLLISKIPLATIS